MSSQGARRRCIIQKLDFENCIITNIKTTARGRKKLRARITREIEEFPQEQEPSSSEAPTQRPTSPVLIKRQCRDGGSPAFTKRKRTSFSEEEELTIEEVCSSPGSPVFKMNKKPKTTNPSQELKSVLGRVSSMDLFNSQGNTSSSFQIDEFTQESKPSAGSAKSADAKNDSNYSVESDEVDPTRRDSSGERTPRSFGARESPKSVRRNYKKNSLLGRLQKLQQKRASEKLLWQHQNRKNSSSSWKFSVIRVWREDFYYFLKCRLNAAECEGVFLVVDSRWVPNVKNVREGSTVHLHPPWQKLQVDESAITVFLNVICLDVLEETQETVLQKKTFESVPINQFETDQKFFVDSLFSVGSTGLLW